MLLAATDYPLLDIFWTMLFFFIWITWFMLVFRIIADLFRRDDMGGFAKAMWMIFVIIAPFLGVLIYVISQGSSMAQRNMQDMQSRQAQFDAHVQSVAGSGGAAAEIEKAKSLLDSGAITQVEYERLKAAALA
jgi:ABC-type multidrug transport system fused ATPase/permease subunit